MITDDRHFEIRIAADAAEIQAAQALRYRVFVEELGATAPGADHAARLERDPFDDLCDHLLLIDRRKSGSAPCVVGAYRLLRGEVAKKGPGFYSAAEFDLSPLTASGRSLLELGRSCVDPAYRGGTAMVHLWNALADYVLGHGVEVMFGVASFHGSDPAAVVQGLSYLHHHHAAPADMNVRVRADAAVDLELLAADKIDRRTALAQIPALIKAYLRLGGVIGEGAFVDRDFNTVDVCLIMDTGRMSARHRDYYTRARMADT